MPRLLITLFAFFIFLGFIILQSSLDSTNGVTFTILSANDPPQASAVPPSGLYIAPQNVVLSSKTTGASIYYTLDGSAPTWPPNGSTQTYISPIAVASSTTIRYFARDSAGNKGAEYRTVYAIDTAKPETGAFPPAGTYGSAIQVSLKTSKPGSIYFTQDGSDPVYPPVPNGSTKVYLGAINIASSGTLKFFTRDLAGNLEQIKSQSYIIDSSALVVTATPPGGLYNSPRSVVLAATKGAAIYYTLDGSTPTYPMGITTKLYSAPITISSAANIKYFARDISGNSTPVASESYTFDTVAPSITSYFPTSGAIDMPLDTVITIDFNKPLAASSVPPPSKMLKIGNRYIPASGALDAGGKRLTIIPTASLTYGTTYSIEVKGVTDPAGNALPTFSINFATVGQNTPTTTTTAPVVTTTAAPVVTTTAVSTTTTTTLPYSASFTISSTSTTAIATAAPDVFKLAPATTSGYSATI